MSAYRGDLVRGVLSGREGCRISQLRSLGQTRLRQWLLICTSDSTRGYLPRVLPGMTADKPILTRAHETQKYEWGTEVNKEDFHRISGTQRQSSLGTKVSIRLSGSALIM